MTAAVVNSRSSGPGWSPCRGHCVVFLDKTLHSLVSPPGCINGYW